MVKNPNADDGSASRTVAAIMKAMPLRLEPGKYVPRPSRKKARRPHRAAANAADNCTLTFSTVQFDRAYKRLPAVTGIADLYASIELHSERRLF